MNQKDLFLTPDGVRMALMLNAGMGILLLFLDMHLFKGSLPKALMCFNTEQ